MLRTFFTELSKTPALYDCTPVSLLGALIQAAQLGLEFGIIGHAYLVPFRNRRRGNIREAQLIPGYKGLLKLARNSGEISTVSAHVVHAGDHFRYAYGLNPMLEHVPAESGPTVTRMADGVEVTWPITYFYAAARMRDGGSEFEVMSLAEVEMHRDRYAADKREDSAWATNFPEMGLKTVLRRLCRLLPQSVELSRALVLDAHARKAESQDLGALVGVSGSEWTTPPAEDPTEDTATPSPPPAGDPDATKRECDTLAALVTGAERAFPPDDVKRLRDQHVGGKTPDAVTDPAVLQDYLAALSKVPRPDKDKGTP
jgi:recombination protein RecT